MKYVCAALIALSVFSSEALGGDLTVQNYQLVSEQRYSLFQSYFTYRAELRNTGQARNALTAKLTGVAAGTTVVAGQDVLQFPAVPAGATVTSSNTFTILVDRRNTFAFDTLLWTILNPIANAGPDQTGPVGSNITLNGSASSNPSGVGSLTYAWQFISKPGSSLAQLSAPNSPSTSFKPDAPGSYAILLTVSNGFATDSATVTVSTLNSKPVANAGSNQTVAVNGTVNLNGTGSSDVDGDPLSYSWTFVSRPPTSAAAIQNPNSAMASFIADKAGTYIAQLIVNDGKLNSDAATVTITTTNTPPVANPGQNQTVAIGAQVQLNGAGSTDVDGDPLTYQWSFVSTPGSSTAQLSSTSAVNPSFTADKPGNYIVQLIVNDGKINSAAKTVTISTNAVQAPTANPGQNQSVKRFTQVTLNGSGTDPQSLPLTFVWALIHKPANSTATLSSTTAQNPTFTVDLPGDYIAQLVVNNGYQNSAPATVTITTTNTAPVANAGQPQTVTAGTLVSLSGAASSDADNDTLTFAWSLTTKPNNSQATLLAATSSSPSFTPDLPGTYVAQLIVSDPYTSSTPVTVTITVTSAGTITVPSNTTVNLGQTAAFAITLPAPAGPTGVTVTLSSSDPNKVSIPASVTISAGQTQPSTQPVVTGVGLGSATITASATGYGSANGTVQSQATLSLAPQSANAVTNAVTNLTLTLSANAPNGGVTVNLSSSTASATVPPTVNIAQGQNSVQVPVTGGSAGQAVITASGANLTGATANITTYATLAFTTTSLTSGVVSTPYTATLAVTGGKSPFTFALTSGTLPPDLKLDTNTGQITGTPTATASATPLTFRVTDSANPAQTTTVNLTLTISQQTPATITVVSGTPQSAAINAAFGNPLVAVVKDSGGNPIQGITVTFAAPGSGASGTFAGGTNTATTNASGIATSAVFTANATAGAYTVTASVSGVGTPANFQLTNTAGGAATITATSGTPQSAAISAAFAAPLVATVKDSGGNPVAGATVTFTAPSSGASGTFAGGTNTATTNASGVATSAVFTANTTAGAYTVTASVSGVGTAANFQLTNTAGGAATITATSGTPQSAAISAAFAAPLVATVKDSGGNPVQGVTVTFTAPSSGASGTFAGGTNTATTNASGVATSAVFTANTVAGAYTVTAAVSGVGTAANFQLTNTAGSAATITATSGTPQTASVNAAFGAPLVATVKDSGGNPVAGVTVTFTAPSSGASGTFAGGTNTATTNASGVATSAVFTANSTLGTYNVVASVSGVATGANFALTNGPGAPASITATGGTPQTANVSTAFANPLAATVKDSFGNPIAGVTVTFTPPSSGASGTFAGGANTAVTNASGVATSAVFTANGTPGQYTVSASVAGLQTTVNFSLTNNASGGGLGTITVQSASVGQNLQTPITITLPVAVGNSGLNITLSSSNTNLKIAPRELEAGQDSQTISLTAGTTSFSVFVQALANAGTSTITVSAPNYTNGTGTITMTPSGFVLEAPNGLGVPSFSTSQGVPVTLTVSSARLDVNSNYVEKQQLRFGLGQVVVPVGSVPTSVGTVSPAGATFKDADSKVNVTFNAIATGSATITAESPAGFGLPGQNYNKLTASVTPSAINFATANVSVGQNLQTTYRVRITTPAGFAGVAVTITSPDISKVTLSATATGSDSGSITVTIPSGQIATPLFYVRGLLKNTSVTLNATATGLGTASGDVIVTPSGFVISGPTGTGTPFTTFLGSANSDLVVSPVRLDTFGQIAEFQDVRGGLLSPFNVAVQSSNQSVGTITLSPLAFNGNGFNTTQFQPKGGGQTTITITPPAGFDAVLSGSQLTANVNAPSFGLSDEGLVGNRLQSSGRLSVASPAGPNGLNVTLQVTSGQILLSRDGLGAGSNQITVTIPPGSNFADYYIYGLGDSGTATYQASAQNFATRTSTITLAPSGVTITGTLVLFGTDTLIVNLSGPARSATVMVGALDPVSRQFLTQQSLAGNQNITVNLINGNSAIGSIPTQVSITSGNSSVAVPFTPATTGTGTISIAQQPPGYSTPSSGTQIAVSVLN
jgi:hypothetical protein